MGCRRFFALSLRNFRGFSSRSSRDAKLSRSTFHGSTRLLGTFPPRSRLDFSQIKGIEAAIDLFDDMLRMKPRPPLKDFAKLMAIVVKMKRYSDALFMFDEMRELGLPLNEYHFAIAINCYCRLLEVTYGFSLLGIHFKLGHKPDVCTFTTLLRGLFLANKVSEAEQLFKRLLREKICEPNEVMLLVVLDGLCKAGNTLTALQMLKLLEKTSYQLDVYCYSTVIDSLCKDRMVDDALSVLSRITKKGIWPDVVTYSSVIRGLCSFGRWKEAEKLLAGMETLKIPPNLVTYNILVDSFCKEGMVQEAEDVISTMSVKDGLCKNGNLDAARDVFEKLPSKGLQPDVRTYTVFIGALCREGFVYEAKELMKKMEERSNCVPNNVTYNVFLQGLLRRNNFDEANLFLEEMNSARFSVDSATLSMIIDDGEAQTRLLLEKIKKFLPRV